MRFAASLTSRCLSNLLGECRFSKQGLFCPILASHNGTKEISTSVFSSEYYSFPLTLFTRIHAVSEGLQSAPSRGFSVSAESENDTGRAKVRRNPTGSTPQQVQRTLRIADVTSPELLAEVYQGPKPRLPLSSWFTVAGWSARYHRALGGLKNIYALARCTRDIKGFGMRAFKTEAIGLYGRVNSLFAAGDLTMLKRQTTGKCFGLMKKELKQREKAGWGSVTWGLAREPTPADVELLQARLLALDPNNPKTHFAQLTIRIRSEHKFAAYDKKGRLVAGDPEAEFRVEDFWVLERALGNPQGRWVLAARLALS